MNDSDIFCNISYCVCDMKLKILLILKRSCLNESIVVFPTYQVYYYLGQGTQRSLTQPPVSHNHLNLLYIPSLDKDGGSATGTGLNRTTHSFTG